MRISIRTRENAIINNLRAIMAVMGFEDTSSESNTEEFAAVLAGAIRHVQRNEDGLNYDTTVGIARYLIEG